MRLADCLVEAVCHSRWLASICLSRLSEQAQDRYADDVETARVMLNALSRSMSHIETLGEVPSECIDALCGGVLYLLVGEVVCQSCPPTMHQFLSQTTLQRQQSAVQTQLLMVRWFSSIGVVCVEDLLEVIFGSGTSMQAYRSDYDAHMAIAKHLAEADPFYLGAHVIILRGLLLKYCADLISVEDIVGHVALVAPDEEAELHTMEDALLFWIRSMLKMLDESTTRALALEMNHVDDLYLHTNDGRMLALVVHQYRPDVVPLSSVHLMNPLTVWQRQDNWSFVTRAAESLGLWVGIFADEMVAHGFSTLQLHVLRVIEELFAVLAVGAERSYVEMSRELDASTTFVAGPPKLPSTAHSIERSNFLEVTPGKVSDQLNDGVDVNERSRHDPELCDEDEDEDVASARDGGAGLDTDVAGREADFNVVLTGMFLQGMKMPIHKQPAQDDKSSLEDAVPVTVQPAVAASTLDIQMMRQQEVLQQQQQQWPQEHRNANHDDTASFQVHHNQTQSVEEIVRASRASHRSTAAADDDADEVNMMVTSPEATRVDPAHRSLAASEPEVVDAATRLFTTASSIDEPPRTTDSPDITRSSVERKVRGGMRSSANQVMTSVAHFEQFRKKGDPRRRGETPGRVGCSVVQGSVDSVGIEQLLDELQSLSSVQPPVAHGAAPSSAVAAAVASPGALDLREQNLQLRWALEEQQRKIAAMVTKLRKGIRKQEFNAIIKHLRVHRAPQAAGGAQLAAGGISPEPVVLGVASPEPLLRMSYAGKSSSIVDVVAKSATGLGASVSASQILPTGPVHKADRDAQVQLPSPKPAAAVAVEPIPVAVASLASPPVSAPARPQAAPAGTAFDVSIGNLRKADSASGGATGAKVPPLSIPQLQKLRERHEKRQQLHNQLQQGGGGDTLFPGKQPVSLPALSRRNNRTVVTNALKHVCLTGPVNKTQLENALKVVADVQDPNAQFVVLLKDEFTHVFRGLYVTNGDGNLTRIYGAGPQAVVVGVEGQEPPSHASFIRYFKFNTGTKKFEILPSRTMNQMTDALSLTGKLPKSATPAPIEVEL